MVTPSAAPRQRARLVEIIRSRSFQSGTATKLASGRSSTFYFNMKPTMLDPEGAHLIGELILDALGDIPVDAIGGLEMGAVPIATVVAAASFRRQRLVPAFFVRKAAKEHGTQSLIEGLAPGQTLAGKALVVVEDVTTTGGSALKAVEALKAAGGRIARVVTIVDRDEGARAAFAAAGIDFVALLTVADFR